jgi:hypothetical protein
MSWELRPEEPCPGCGCPVQPICTGDDYEAPLCGECQQDQL